MDDTAPVDLEEQLRVYIRTWMSSRLKTALAPEDDERTFTSIGLDSVSLLELVTKLQNDFGLLIDDFAAYEFSTAVALSGYLANLQHHSGGKPLIAKSPGCTSEFPDMEGREISESGSASESARADGDGMARPAWSRAGRVRS